MGKNMSTSPAKGMRDFLPQQTELRDWLISTIVSTYRSFGFERIETPVCEDIRRLRHSEGGENLQLLFEILKRGNKLKISADSKPEDLVEMGLRFDLTVPLVRYYGEHRAQLASPFKAIQVGSVWRAERPQKGRYRQFTQCDIDVIGGDSPETEIEILQASCQALQAIGFDSFELKINDRRILTALAKQAGFADEQVGSVLITLDKFDKIGAEGVEQELLKKEFDTRAVKWIVSVLGKDSPQIAEFQELLPGLEAGVFDDLQKTVASLSSLVENCTVCFEPFLVRGMGYYTGQIFEVHVPGSGLGSFGGGGRYDNMVGKMSGIDVPACGFSIGFERVFYLLDEKGVRSGDTAGSKLAIFYDARSDFTAALQIASEQRTSGKSVSVFPAPKKMKSKLLQLEQSGYTEFAFYRAGQALEIKSIGNKQ